MIAREAEGVPGAVKVLMMLLHRESPLAEPRAQRFDDSLAFERVPVENLPLVEDGAPALFNILTSTEIFPTSCNNADHLNHCARRVKKPKLVGDEVGVRTNPLRVTAGTSIV